MNKKIQNLDHAIPLKPADDLLELTRTYSLPRLSYIDISQQEQLLQMMTRWPLINELARL